VPAAQGTFERRPGLCNCTQPDHPPAPIRCPVAPPALVVLAVVVAAPPVVPVDVVLAVPLVLLELEVVPSPPAPVDEPPVRQPARRRTARAAVVVTPVPLDPPAPLDAMPESLATALSRDASTLIDPPLPPPASAGAVPPSPPPIVMSAQ